MDVLLEHVYDARSMNAGHLSPSFLHLAIGGLCLARCCCVVRVSIFQEILFLAKSVADFEEVTPRRCGRLVS